MTFTTSSSLSEIERKTVNHTFPLFNQIHDYINAYKHNKLTESYVYKLIECFCVKNNIPLDSIILEDIDSQYYYKCVHVKYDNYIITAYYDSVDDCTVVNEFWIIDLIRPKYENHKKTFNENIDFGWNTDYEHNANIITKEYLQIKKERMLHMRKHHAVM